MNGSPSLPHGMKTSSSGRVGPQNGFPAKRMAPQPPTKHEQQQQSSLAALAYSMPPCTPSTWASPHGFLLSNAHTGPDWTRVAALEAKGSSPITNGVVTALNLKNEQTWNGPIKQGHSYETSPPLDSPCSTPKQTRGLTSLLNDTSQGSCDTTPATPDSLIGSSSLICSDEDGNNSNNTTVLTARHHTASSSGIHLSCSPSSSLTSPPFEPTSGGTLWRGSISNLSSQQQRDNLIEEVTTPVPMCSHNNNFLISCSSSSAPSSPSTSSRAGSLSSPASPISPFRSFHHDTGTIKRNTLTRKHQGPPPTSGGGKMYASLYPEMSVPTSYGLPNGHPEERESLIKRSASNQHMNGTNQTLASAFSINYRQYHQQQQQQQLQQQHNHYGRSQQQEKTGTHANVCHYATIQRRPPNQGGCGTGNGSRAGNVRHEPPASRSNVKQAKIPSVQSRLMSARSQDLPLSDVRTLASSVSVEGSTLNGSTSSFPTRSNSDLYLRQSVAFASNDLLGSSQLGQDDVLHQARGFSNLNNNQPYSSDSDTDNDVYALEEKIRKQSSFPSLLHSRPYRKPPFTIESAMSAVYQTPSPHPGRNGTSAINNTTPSRDNGGIPSSKTGSNLQLQQNYAPDLPDSSISQIQSIQQELINQHQRPGGRSSGAVLFRPDPLPQSPTVAAPNQDVKSRGKRPRKDRNGGLNGAVPGSGGSQIPRDPRRGEQEEVRGRSREQPGGRSERRSLPGASQVSSILARLKISGGDLANGPDGLPDDRPSQQQLVRSGEERLDEIKSLEETDPMLIDSNSSLSQSSSPPPPPLPAKNGTLLATKAQVNSQELRGNGNLLRRSIDRESKAPLISKEPTNPFSTAEDDLEDETETGDETDSRKRRKRRQMRRKQSDKDRQKDKLDQNGIDPDDDGRNDNEDLVENEMEYCDPCYCYGKCCLDVVASIFCVSLL